MGNTTNMDLCLLLSEAPHVRFTGGLARLLHVHRHGGDETIFLTLDVEDEWNTHPSLAQDILDGEIEPKPRVPGQIEDNAGYRRFVVVVATDYNWMQERGLGCLL